MSHPETLKRLLAALMLGLTLQAQAGQACEEKPLTVDTFKLAMGAAENLATRLDQMGGDVYVIGRMGQDLSKYDLRYTHAAFVYKQADGHWRVAHLLNDCGTDHSDLWYEGLGNFFMDDMFRYDAVVITPPPALAERLKQRLDKGGMLRSLHTPRYSLTAYPFATRYENSNTWVLENLAAATSVETRIGSREQAQMWLKLNNYTPSELNIGAMTRLGGRMFKANVAFDDHPNELRYKDRIQTVSVDSIIRFYLDRNEGWQVVEVPAPLSKHY